MKFEHSASIDVLIKTFVTEFWKFIVKGRFSTKRKKFLQNVQRLATSGHRNATMITDIP